MPFEVGAASPLTVAAGLEYREDTFEIKPGDEASRYKEGSQSYPGFSLTDAGSHKRDSKAVYVDFAVDPIAALQLDAAIRYAINHPYNSEPLYAKLRPGMKVVIAMDDVSVPLPPMKQPDVRERVLTIVLQLLADHGVDDFEMIIATSVHRKMTGPEVRHIVGDKIFDAYWPKRLYNHDAEDPQGMKFVGETELGERVVLNRRAVELGPSGGSLVEVRAGVSEGERVVADGGFLLKSELLR